MNVIGRLTLRHMKRNKRRSLVTIAGTIVSVAMITAVLIIAATFMQMFQEATKLDTGDWHVAYNDIAVGEIAKITDSPDTASTIISHYEGWIDLPDSADRNRRTMIVTGYTEDSFVRMPLKMIEGTYPKSSDELLVSQNFIDTAQLDWKVGDTVTVLWGYYTQGNEAPITNSAGIRDPQEISWHGEGERTYILTGIAEMSSRMEMSWSGAYQGITGLDAEALTADELVSVQQALTKVNTGLYEKGRTMAVSVGLEEPVFNNSLLVYYGVTENNAFRSTMISVVSILALVIMVGSVSLIYNAFAISLVERGRMLGMLASVGATKRQKKSSVFCEAAIVGVIAIPLGLVCGYLGIAITFKFLEPTLQQLLSTSDSIRVAMPLWAIAGAVIFSIMVLFVSAWIPARKAAQITPIEAIRSNQAVKISAKQIRTLPLTGRLFGFEAELGLKNIKRSRSRYLATLFSLIISVVLFLTAVTFTGYMAQAFGMTQINLQFEVAASAQVESNAERDELMALMKNQRYSDGAVFTHQIYIQGIIPKEDIPAQALEADAYFIDEQGQHRIDILVNFMDEEGLRAFGQKAGIDVTALLSDELRGIVISPITVKTEQTFADVYQLKESVQSISGLDGYLDPITIDIIGTTAELPIYMTGYQGNAETIYILSSMQAGDAWFAELAPGATRNLEGCFNSRQSTMLYNDLNKLAKQYSQVYVQDWAANIRLNQQLMTMMDIFIYGFVALIVLVCAANIFNTISTGVALRGREFAMLRSVGITPGKFNKMVCYESLFYGIKALAYGLPISVLLAVLMYRSLGVSFAFAFTLPWGAYLAAISGVLLLVGSTMASAVGRIKRTNLIDGLKNENL